MINSNQYICPICGYDQLSEPAYDDTGCPTFAICPCCGMEFGYDDMSIGYDKLRQRWIDSGMHWWSTSITVPLNWSPVDQMRRAGFPPRGDL